MGYREPASVDTMTSAVIDRAQTPASGPNISNALRQALQTAESVAQSQQRLDARVCDDCRIWLELLHQSQDRLHGEVAPAIRRSSLDSASNLALTKRRWDRFLRWFHRNMLPPLKSSSERSGVPIVYPARASDRRGGRPELSEAHYFLSFQAPIERATAIGASSSSHQAGKPRRLPAGRSVPSDQHESQDHLHRSLTDRLMRLLVERDLEIDTLKSLLARRVPPES